MYVNEALERRLLLAVVTVSGSAGNDLIDLQKSGTSLIVRNNGTASITVNNLITVLPGMPTTVTDADAVSVSGSSGNDRIESNTNLNIPVTMAGGSGSDTLIGGAVNDSLAGGDGNDSIRGFNGNDTLSGDSSAQTGADTIHGEAGNDSIRGGNGNDFLNGDASGQTGSDTIYGDLGNDSIFGGAGGDVLHGDDNDSNLGNDGADSIRGGDGNDYISGNGGADRMFGENNDDIFSNFDGVADITVSGGSGNDRAANDSLDTPVFNSIESIVAAVQVQNVNGAVLAINGTEADDVIEVSGDGVDLLFITINDSFIIESVAAVQAQQLFTLLGIRVFGLGGNDRITLLDGIPPTFGFGSPSFLVQMSGGDGNDTLVGRAIADQFFGDGGNDSFIGNGGNDLFSGGTSFDTVDYSWATTPVSLSIDGVINDGLAGESASIEGDMETLIGGSGNDTLTGHGFINLLVGNAGNDSLLGNASLDTLIGGPGDDILDGGTETDTADYSDHPAAVDVSLDGSANDGSAGEADNVRTNIEVVIGSDFNDTLEGGNNDETLIGGDGADRIDAGRGNDSVLGGPGNDFIDVLADTDTVDGEAGDDRIRVTNATARFNQSQDLQELGISNGTVVIDTLDPNAFIATQTLAIVSNGALDLSACTLLLDYTGASPLASMRTLVGTGHAGGTWLGTGIRSSLAAFSPGNTDAVGYAEATAQFSTFPAQIVGRMIDSTTVVVRYTRVGDANLDRRVNLDDFTALAAGFGRPSPLWHNGDFNFDGVVALDDFTLLATNFGTVG